MSYAFPPLNFAIWNYASLNEESNPTYTTKWDEFETKETYKKTVGTD